MTMKRIAVLFLVVGTPALASLKDKQAYAEHEEKFAEEVEFANKACGTQFTWKIDWASFEKGKADIHGNSVGSSFCGDGVGALRQLCADALGKKEVTAKVKGIVCKYGGKGKRSISLSGKKVIWTVDFEAGNNLDFAKEWLENKL